jgi:hypothetical protein
MTRVASLNRRFVKHKVLTPSVVALTIAATRTYRSLTEFASARNNLNLCDMIQFRFFLLHAHDGRRFCTSPHIVNSGDTSSIFNRPRTYPAHLSLLEVTVHKTYEVDQMNHHASQHNSYIDMKGKPRNNLVVPESDVKVENSVEIHSQDLTDVSKTV